jgi:AraC family transcriptional regulator, transcriptional activator of pobA
MDGVVEGLHNSNMPASDRQPTRLPPAAHLPTYALYGEHGRTQATDWLHCETIRERSQRHDWEIRPHRHESLFQILHIQRGSAEALIDAAVQHLDGPCVVTVPPLVPHGFRFSSDIEGTVVTVLERHLVELLSGAGGLAAPVMQSRCLVLGQDDASAQPVERSVAALRAEFFGTAPWRDLALDAALLTLVVALGRSLPASAAGATPAAGDRALLHVRRLRALVEARFRSQPSLAVLAADIGITTTQLNRACRQVLGHSALGVLHARLMLEAQRDLAYTTLSVKQIALGLGFADAAYFTRFFAREAGMTPTAWRARALQ